MGGVTVYFSELVSRLPATDFIGTHTQMKYLVSVLVMLK